MISMFKKRIVYDLNTLPSEYKTKEGFDIKKFEKDFNIKIIPYDHSPQNTAGAVVKPPYKL